jgi:hypothetical protein
MSKLRFLVLLAALALMLSLPAVASAQEVLPHVFTGTARVNGEFMAPGTEITALINGEEQGSTTVKANGEYEALVVEQGNGTEITFRVGTLTADQMAIWKSGAATMLDLTASSNSPGP